MSLTELMRTANALNTEERIFLAAYLKHLSRADDPGYKAELARLNQEIDEGKKLSLEIDEGKKLSLDQVKRLHEALKAEGM